MLIVTDLDGTLLPHNGAVSESDLKTLRDIENKHIRVIATGRHLHSLRKVIPVDFPIDYVVFSSGAGIVDWKKQELIFQASLERNDIEFIATTLAGMGLNYMLHAPVPENHHLKYHVIAKPHEDFNRRIERHKEFAKPLASISSHKNASQFLVVFDKEDVATFGLLKRSLPQYTVIRATSPLDRESLWIEIFPITVSKAKACMFLCEKLAILNEHTHALGNDHNDVELLHWASKKYIVSDSAPELLPIFPQVASSTSSAFSEFVARILLK